MGSGRTHIRPRAMVPIAPDSRSSATAGRLVASDAALSLDVSQSADPRRTTEGFAAPGLANKHQLSARDLELTCERG